MPGEAVCDEVGLCCAPNQSAWLISNCVYCGMFTMPSALTLSLNDLAPGAALVEGS